MSVSRADVRRARLPLCHLLRRACDPPGHVAVGIPKIFRESLNDGISSTDL